MRIFILSCLVMIPAGMIYACAPGKAGVGGGIGCSKTSSVVKTPQIRTYEEITTAPSAETLRNRFVKFFGTESPLFSSGSSSFVQSSTGGLKNTGGYIYIESRAANDPLGPVQSNLSRCSVLLEFPKNKGDSYPPESTGTPKFPSSSNEIDSFRFPSINDPLKLRIYTAAHCLDFSTNEKITLSIFNITGTDLPPPSQAYSQFKIKVPELEAVKTLRSDVQSKIQDGVISATDGVKILRAFRPIARNLDKIFGSDTTTSRGKCNFKPDNPTDSSNQYSCATYHDLAVLDVEIDENLTTERLNLLKAIRSNWVQKIKAEESKGIWAEFVKPPFNDVSQANMVRQFVDSVLTSTIDSSLQSDSAKSTHPESCVAFPQYNAMPTCMESSTGSGFASSSFTTFTTVPPPTPTPIPTASLLPTPTPIPTATPLPTPIPTTPTSSSSSTCPKLTTKLALFHPTIANCVEVPMSNSANLNYMRYITRERLRRFSRHNLISNIKELTEGLSIEPLNLHNCGADINGVCSLKSSINTALDILLPSLQIETISQFQSNYVTATKYVDASLSVWNPFFAVAYNVDLENSNQTIAGSPANTSFLKEIINPIDFLKLHSNFIILDENISTLPDASDSSTHRAFMTMPMANVVGLNSIIFSSESDKPIAIDTWQNTGAGSGFGKFLRLFVSSTTLNSFFTGSFSGMTSPTLPDGVSFPPFGTVWIPPSQASLMQALPTKVMLQKGDSGSIFTLDGIPTFALSTVNGEPTSGGAAVRAIPVAGADTDDSLPGGGSVATSGGGGGGIAAGNGGGGSGDGGDTGGAVASRGGNLCK